VGFDQGIEPGVRLVGDLVQTLRTQSRALSSVLSGHEKSLRKEALGNETNNKVRDSKKTHCATSVKAAK
jgi:hypothetical protein